MRRRLRRGQRVTLAPWPANPRQRIRLDAKRLKREDRSILALVFVPFATVVAFLVAVDACLPAAAY